MFGTRKILAGAVSGVVGGLVFGLMIFAVMVLAVKNIPGLLERTLLQRLPLDAGARGRPRPRGSPPRRAPSAGPNAGAGAAAQPVGSLSLPTTNPKSVTVSPADVCDKAPIDFQRVDGKVTQVAQRRIACTKIIQCYGYSKLFEAK